MIDRQTIANAFDTQTAAVLGAAPAIAFVYGNMEQVGLSEGTAPYVKQRVFFTEDSQAELGNDCFRKQEGYLLFIVCVRKGTGDYDRNRIIDRITRGFRSKQIGDATTLDPLIGVSSESEQWSFTGVNIPFWFHNPED